MARHAPTVIHNLVYPHSIAHDLGADHIGGERPPLRGGLLL
jgi:hypothetical protein